MAFAPQVRDWPLLLCGPILRRVSLSSVTVFLAFAYARQVTVRVFAWNADASKGSEQGTHSGTPQSTLQIGERLHVIAVTASGLNLQPSTPYFYDLEINRSGTRHLHDLGAQTVTLGSLPDGLLSGQWPLGYRTGQLPSFVTPPLSASDLHFYHGSCRKIHGGGGDALLRLDDELDFSFDKPASRPQMLLLTGDQIYADDVAGPLLPVLTELAGKLLGWEEKLPDKGGPSLLKGFPPGTRGRFILREQMSSGHGHCHLLGLGEFYAMYLLAFAPALWPTTLPEAGAALPAAALGPAPEPGGVDEPAEITLVRAYLAKNSWTMQSKFVAKFREGQSQVRRVLANIPSYMMFDDHEITDDWYLNRDWQAGVLSTELGQRVIGNALSAYAVFQGWGNDPEGQFATGGPGREVLTKLARLGALNSDTYKAGQPDYDVVRQLLRVVAQSGSVGILWDYGLRLPGSNWQFLVLDTRTHRNLTQNGQTDLIDIPDMARQITARASALASGPPSMPPAEVTLLVSPAPVFGHPLVEEAVGNVANRNFPDAVRAARIDPTNLDPFLSVLANILTWNENLRTSTDNESWHNEIAPAAFEKLIDTLSQLGRVVILSGDVHYGFSASVAYWNDRPGRLARSMLVQLCSSALRNEDTLTHIVGSLGSREMLGLLDALIKSETQVERKTLAKLLNRGGLLVQLFPTKRKSALKNSAAALLRTAGTLLDGDVPQIAKLAPSLTPPAQLDYVGWSSVRPVVPANSGLRQPDTLPAVMKVGGNPLPNSFPAVDWGYRIRFCADLGQELPDADEPGQETNEVRIKRFMDELLTCSPSSQHRLVVGQSNIGRVRIKGASGHYTVRHTMERMDSASRPATSHFLPLDPPDESEPKPGLQGTRWAPNLSLWMDLLSHLPPPPFADQIRTIDRGFGPVRVDCYGIHVTRPPTSLPSDAQTRSVPVSLEEFMTELRRLMLTRGMFDPGSGSFSGKLPDDTARWSGSHTAAVGATLIQHNITITTLPGSLDFPIEYQATTVTPTTFVLSLSAVESNLLVGARGIFGSLAPADEAGWYIFSLGAHRNGSPQPFSTYEWDRLHRLWQSFPDRMSALLSANGGAGTKLRSAQHEVLWNDVANAWFAPATP